MLLAYGLTVDGMLGSSLMDDHLKLRDHCGFTSHPPALRTNRQTLQSTVLRRVQYRVVAVRWKTWLLVLRSLVQSKPSK